MNEKDSIAQCDICLLGVYMKCNNLTSRITNIFKAQMILGTVSLVVVKFFLLEHYHIKTFYLIQTFSQGINSDNDKESSLSLKPSDLALLLY